MCPGGLHWFGAGNWLGTVLGMLPQVGLLGQSLVAMVPLLLLEQSICTTVYKGIGDASMYIVWQTLSRICQTHLHSTQYC